MGGVDAGFQVCLASDAMSGTQDKPQPGRKQNFRILRSFADVQLFHSPRSSVSKYNAGVCTHDLSVSVHPLPLHREKGKCDCLLGVSPRSPLRRNKGRILDLS